MKMVSLGGIRLVFGVEVIIGIICCCGGSRRGLLVLNEPRCYLDIGDMHVQKHLALCRYGGLIFVKQHPRVVP